MTPPSGWKHVFAGSSFAITIVLCVFAGNWLDGRYGTDPWGVLVGTLFGIAAAFYNLMKEFKDESSD